MKNIDVIFAFSLVRNKRAQGKLWKKEWAMIKKDKRKIDAILLKSQ